jgi:hypothetical protein
MTAGRRGLRVALVVMLAALGGAAAASAAGSLKARSVSASAGTTAATATYDEVSGSAGAPYANLRLAIVRDGRTLFDAPVKAGFCGTQCWPDVWPGHGFLRVADIESNGSPDVVLDLYSGGAHCCSIVEVYRFDAATGAYGIVQHNFWDPGASLERIDGGYEFVSADDHFAYTFAAFAFSGLPLQIWRFEAGRFVDVTRRFPGLIAADAKRQWGAYVENRAQGYGLGFLAAWAADEDLLGRGARVATTLAAQQRAGWLRSAGGYSPSGEAFIAALLRFLAKYGYAN